MQPYLRVFFSPGLGAPFPASFRCFPMKRGCSPRKKLMSHGSAPTLRKDSCYKHKAVHESTAHVTTSKTTTRKYDKPYLSFGTVKMFRFLFVPRELPFLCKEKIC